jgi:hypothetical protein
VRGWVSFLATSASNQKKELLSIRCDDGIAVMFIQSPWKYTNEILITKYWVI